MVCGGGGVGGGGVGGGGAYGVEGGKVRGRRLVGWEGVCVGGGGGGEGGLALTYDGDTERRPAQQSSDSWRQLKGNYHPEVETNVFRRYFFVTMLLL